MKYVPGEDIEFGIQLYKKFQDDLSEPVRRQFLAMLVEQGGYGSQQYVCQETGADSKTVERGRKEIKYSQPLPLEEGHQRMAGGGRKTVEDLYPALRENIQEIIEDYTYGNPMNPLCYTTLSDAKISGILEKKYGIPISAPTVAKELGKMGYSRHTNHKMLQASGTYSPNRDKQFQTINETSRKFLDEGQPVISVDTKKKEILGNFKNAGTEYLRNGSPREVLDHDFLNRELGKVSPYGVYVLNDNTGFVNLGTDHDTAGFSAESIRRWWQSVGQATFPDARRLYITCDGGGSNRSGSHPWKYDLAVLAEQTGLEIWVSHFPPGTSKWNKIEHRLFSYISKNWQGKPLIDIETVVELIGSTTTKTGLKVKCVVDYNKYPLGVQVDDEAYDRIDWVKFGNETGWNYIIRGFKH